MTPDRWQRVKQIFNSALRLEPSQRSTFLSDACDRDDALRKEIESLLEAHEKDGSFIDSPAFDHSSAFSTSETSAFKPGQTFGSYVLTSFIGRGGMGDVYLATDTRLSRNVALKILPAAVMRDVERVRRFELEARATSALNHPNIITIYEITEVNSTLMIASEFVEGPTLRQRLASGPLNLRDALNIAIQIADALAAAHKVGIIHRDIKPENIMIRPDGYVKVLHFGLAKLAELQLDESINGVPTQIKTKSGVVIGTVGYMSPEQARGQLVDARSDIFNLGSVIYEMIAGQAPFAGETPSDVFAAILKSEPQSLSVVAPETPPELVAIVDKALRKDRNERYNEVNKLLGSLKSVKEDLDFQAKLDRSTAVAQKSTGKPGAAIIETKSAKTEPSVIGSVRRGKLYAFLALLILVLMIGGMYVVIKRVRTPAVNVQIAPPTELLQATQITSWAGFDCYPALSPDGLPCV